MNRATRTGRVFSPYVIDPAVFATLPPADVIHTGVDLGPILQTALANADRRAAALDRSEHAEEDAEEWEDITEELESRPPSPLSDLTATPPPSREPSLTRLEATGHPNATAAHAVSLDSPDELSEAEDGHMPPLVSDIQVRRKRANNYARRRRHRAEAHAAKHPSPFDRTIRAKHSQDHRQQPHETTAFDTAAAYTSEAGAWVGGRGSRHARRRRTLPALTRAGVLHIRWDGRSPKLILDAHGRIIAILLGRPEDPDWDDVVRDAIKAMNRARRAGFASGAFRARDTKHRRGSYAVLSTGVSFGGGQKRPGNLVNSAKRQKIINYLLRNKSLRRLAGFQSSGFARFAPKLWRYYVDNLRLLFEHHDGLQHNFTNSIFPATTLNLGPQVVTDTHFDLNNLMHGLCGITAAGDFDHTVGGQIHMEQIKVVIDFPSGSSMLIPSAFIAHGNTPIQEGETRLSLTQYAAGGLFRWIKYGFRSAKSVLACAGGADLVASFDGVPGSRWEWAMNLFSKPEELEGDRRAALGPAYI
ncbi:hypothetical protein DFH09DRAFT_1286332 [Mycena vulgaris]|nr:hypothetical protein DFH09DRAFT_1286332 [Mycena vulgaris]